MTDPSRARRLGPGRARGPHVLAVRLDNLGDVLLAGPAVRALASRARRLTLLCGPDGAAAGRILPGVDEVATWSAPWVGFDPPDVDHADVERLVGLLAAANLDEAVVFTSFHQSPLPLALLLRLAGVPRICAVSVDYPGSLLDVRHRVDEDMPEAERALSLARAAGYDLPPGDSGRLAVCGPLPRVRHLVDGRRYVVVHPAASVPARTWSGERWARAVEELGAAGHEVVVTGGPGDRELTAVAAGSAARDLGGRTDVAQLAAVLAGAAVVVAPNTGPAHLAAAVGTPVVSLFAPVVSAARWAPYGVPCSLLGDQNAPCRDTRARDCPVAGHPCLNAVAPGEVLAAVRRLAAAQRHP